MSLLLAALAPLLLSGCDVTKLLGGKQEEDTSASIAPTAAPLPASDIRRQTGGTASQLLQAYEQSRGGGAASPDNDPGRVTFDGANGGVAGIDGIVRDALSGVPAGVPAGGFPQYPPREPIPYSDAPARVETVVPPPPAAGVKLLADEVGPSASAAGAGPTLAHFDSFQRVSGLFSRSFEVISRAAWGAQAPRRAGVQQAPERVAVHHTDGVQTMSLAASVAAVRAIQHHHRNVADRRKPVWDDIGYHFLIDGEGRVFEGRHAEIMGAHAGAAGNFRSVAISMMGNFDRDRLTELQRDSLVRLVSFLSIKYRRDPSAHGFIEPHQHFMGTDCPGRDVMAFLRSGSLVRESQQMITRLSGNSRFLPGIVVPPSA